MTIRVLIADDQPLVRTGLRVIFEAEPEMVVVGEAGNGREAVEAAASADPDVVTMDVRMPGMDGLEATRHLTAGGGTSSGSARVLVLTTFDVDEYVYEALRAGASGFLLKDAPRAELVEGVRVVARGDALLAPSVTRRLISEFARRPAPPSPGDGGLAALTPREREVLALIARGLSNAEMAAHLYVGEATVKSHVGRVLMKLGLRDRVQAVIFAYEAGLVTPGA